MLISLIILYYYLVNQPMQSSILNFTEIINESTFLLVLYFSLAFKEYREFNHEQENFYGSVFIYLVIANISINVLILLYTVIKALYQFLARKCRDREINRRIKILAEMG